MMIGGVASCVPRAIWLLLITLDASDPVDSMLDANRAVDPVYLDILACLAASPHSDVMSTGFLGQLDGRCAQQHLGNMAHLSRRPHRSSRSVGMFPRLT